MIYFLYDVSKELQENYIYFSEFSIYLTSYYCLILIVLAIQLILFLIITILLAQVKQKEKITLNGYLFFFNTLY